MGDEDGEHPFVMLSAAKHLEAHRERPFAALRVTRRGQGARPSLRSELALNAREWGDKTGHPLQRRASSAHLPSPSGILNLCLRLIRIGGPALAVALSGLVEHIP